MNILNIKTNFIPKRETVLVAPVFPCIRWLVLFPHTCSLCSVSLYCEQCQCSSLTVTPWEQGKLLENPSVCEEGAFKGSRWHMDLSPSCSRTTGEALISSLYETLQELHIHLATGQLPGSQTFAVRLHQRTLWYWSFSKLFRPSVNNILLHSVTAHCCPQRTLNGSILGTHIHVQGQKSISPHRSVIPKYVQFAPIPEICS